MFFESVPEAKTKSETHTDHELPYDSSPKPNVSALCFVVCSNFAFREERIHVRVLDMFCLLQKWSPLLCVAMVGSFLILKPIWYSFKNQKYSRRITFKVNFHRWVVVRCQQT